MTIIYCHWFVRPSTHRCCACAFERLIFSDNPKSIHSSSARNWPIARARQRVIAAGELNINMTIIISLCTNSRRQAFNFFQKEWNLFFFWKTRVTREREEKREWKCIRFERCRQRGERSQTKISFNARISLTEAPTSALSRIITYPHYT